ncbi:MAG: hypothetical protein JNM30_02615 [Rhodospirillales bacterium]|nr:hypothetical protein [Rhodospirillales bacterium]
MKPRITVNMTAQGEFEVWVNPAGRDLLVQELQRLNEKHEHFHLGPESIGDVEICSRPYRPDDRILDYGKVLFRTDDWDRQFFPHVMDAEDTSNSS